jgi:hypothetical protein
VRRARFSFTTVFLNNAVIIIDALQAKELQTGVALMNTLRDLDLGAAPRLFERHPVTSVEEVAALLQDVQQRALHGLKPILHFEGHASQRTGLCLPNGAWLSWPQLFTWCRSINGATDYNLGVVVAACYGLHAITPLKINQPAPFQFLLAPQDVVAAGSIADNLPAFYRELLVAGQIDEQLAQRFHCTVFLAEKFLVTAYAKYLKRASVGAGRARRVEELVTRSAAKIGHRNRTMIRKFRREAKKLTKPTRGEFEHYARLFLPGGHNIDFDRLLRWVRAGIDE